MAPSVALGPIEPVGHPTSFSPAQPVPHPVRHALGCTAALASRARPKMLGCTERRAFLRAAMQRTGRGTCVAGARGYHLCHAVAFATLPTPNLAVKRTA